MSSTSRVQLALNVSDLEAAVDHYTRLLGTEPAKTRPGYANFAVADPPLKLVPFENPDEGGTLDHLGTEVSDTDAVASATDGLVERGIDARMGETHTCCYATQDKTWIEDPDGLRWEIYTVLADSPAFGDDESDDAACCGASTAEASTGACCA